MKVAVRWWDGYFHVFDNVEDWRAGSDLLWIAQRKNIDCGPLLERHIPLSRVRWFSPSPTDREKLAEELKK